MVKDIILDDENDVNIVNGDFQLRESDTQHIVLVINTFAGNWKQYPFCGVGIIQFANAAGQGVTLKRSMQVQLEADGFEVEDIKLYSNSSGLYDYYVNAKRP